MIQQIRAWKKQRFGTGTISPMIQPSLRPLPHFHAGDLLTGNQCPAFVATIFGHPYCVLFLSTVWCLWIGCVRFSYHLAKGRFQYCSEMFWGQMPDRPDIVLKPLRCLVVEGFTDFLWAPHASLMEPTQTRVGPQQGSKWTWSRTWCRKVEIKRLQNAGVAPPPAAPYDSHWAVIHHLSSCSCEGHIPQCPARQGAVVPVVAHSYASVCHVNFPFFFLFLSANIMWKGILSGRTDLS